MAALDRLTTPVRYLPIVLLATIAGPILILANPGLFWDDWVWFLQAPEHQIRIGRELGVWWAGYANNFLYALPHPTTVLRFVAFFAWIAMAGAIALTFMRLKIIRRRSAFVLFLLICASHAAPIRFVNSVAFYNVYIGCFWIGAAILSIKPRSILWQVLALPFFFFSFYLNSMLALYGGVLLILLWLTVREVYPEVKWRTIRWRATASAMARGELNDKVRGVVLMTLGRYPHFILLPVIFYLLGRITRQSSPLYDSYNALGGGSTLLAIPDGVAKLPGVVADYFSSAAQLVNFDFFFIIAIVFVVAYLILPKRTVTQPRTVLMTFLAGLVVTYLGLVPYLAVAKKPEFGDFYDARNGLVVVAGIALLQVAVIDGVDRFFAVRAPFLARVITTLLISGSLALSVHATQQTALGMLKDWLLTSRIEQFAKDNEQKFADYGTVLFIDDSATRVAGRQIINYEYTGMLVQAFGDKTRFGASLAEYLSLPGGTPLLHEKYMKIRYNLDDYNPKAHQLVIQVTRTPVQLTGVAALRILWDYWRGGEPGQATTRYFSFSVSEVYEEVGQRLAELGHIVDAIKKYRADHGMYPVNMTNALPTYSAFGLVQRMTLSSPTTRLTPIEPILVPGYLRPGDLSADCNIEHCGYTYISNGVDYKLVYSPAQDMPFARQAYPGNIDPSRPSAYGYWTTGARLW